jgi:pyridoxamine 5'-phosphate oxidase
LAPQLVEFWQQRDNRVHDRVIYQREGEGWRLERWSP